MLFKREFIRNLKSLIIWTIIIGGYSLLMLSIFPQFAKDQEKMQQLLEAYPEGIAKAFGLHSLDLGSLIGFYGIEIYMMTTLLGSIFAAMLAGNIIAKEENEKTIEFLLSKPITRTQIITQKLLAVGVNILILNGVVAILTVIGFQFTKDAEIPYDTFTLLVAATVLLHLTFAAISYALSTVMKKTRSIISVSLAIALGSYFLNVMAGVSEDLENVKYVSFFKYVDAAELVKNNAMDLLYAGIMAAVILICIVFTFMYYRKKDIAG